MMQKILSKILIAPTVISLAVGAFLGEEWHREIPLSKKLCQLFAVNDGSTFEMKGLYLLALVLMALYAMVSVPFVLWVYLLYAVASVLLIASGIMFIRTFINKASWSKEDLEDGQD